MRNRARLVMSVVLLFAVEPLVNCGDASFTGGDADAGNDDGATDGPRDGQPLDGGVADANSVDSSFEPCTGAEHWICDTFDRSGSINGALYWDLPTVSIGASLTMEAPGDPAPPSSPNALIARASGNQAAIATKAGATSGTGIHCEIDFRIDESAFDYGSNFGIVTLSAGSALYRLVMTAGPVGAGGDGFSNYGTFPDGGGSVVGLLEKHDFPRGAWTHVAIEVAAGPNEPQISIDGVSIPYVSNVDLSAFSGVTGVSVQIGTANYAGDGGWAVAYDNAYCDLIP